MKRLLYLLLLASTVGLFMQLRLQAQNVISIGKPVYGNGSTLAALTDGTTTANYSFQMQDFSNPHPKVWVGPPEDAGFTIDLENISTVAGFRILGDISPGSGYTISQYSIQLSTNGYDYNTVVNRRSELLVGFGSDGYLVWLAATQQARYVHFIVNAIVNPGGIGVLGASLTEFEVLSDEPAAPHIIEHPASMIRRPGDVLTLQSRATGAKALTYQWQRNLTDVSGATNSTITITNTPSVGSGAYRVLVSTTNSTIASSNSVLAAFGMQQGATGPEVLLDGPAGYHLALESRTTLKTNVSWIAWTNVTLGTLPMIIPADSGVFTRFMRAFLNP